jgi:type IV fimbrial biogenesis protein FimT
MKKNTGFTLLELMVVIAIVGILFSVAAPSLKAFMQGNQLVASTNELLAAFHVARSEAIKLNSKVTICESSDGATCDSTTGDWTEGWIVFVDADGNGLGTGAECTATGTDCLLRVHDEVDDDFLTMKGLDQGGLAVSSYTFTSRGLPKANDRTAQSGVFSLCSYSGSASASNFIGSRAVILSLSGRVRVAEDSPLITCP